LKKGFAAGIPGQGGGVARDVDQARRSGCDQPLQRLRRKARARRVHHRRIQRPRAVRQHRLQRPLHHLHVLPPGDVLQQVIHRRRVYLHRHHQPRPLRQRQGEEAHAAVTVQDHLAALGGQVVQHQPDQSLCLEGIGLEEGRGGDPVRVPGDLFGDVRLTDQGDGESVRSEEDAGDGEVYLQFRGLVLRRLQDEHPVAGGRASPQGEGGQVRQVQVQRIVEFGEVRVQNQAFLYGDDVAPVLQAEAQAAGGGGMKAGLVAVGPAGGVRERWEDGRVGEAADAGQLLRHHLRLEAQLRVVGGVLQVASAAAVGAEVRAWRHDPLRGGLQDLHQPRAGVAGVVLHNFGAHRLAGEGVGDKDDLALVPSDGRAAMGDTGQMKGEHQFSFYTFLGRAQING
jgi:hypothetical protein